MRVGIFEKAEKLKEKVIFEGSGQDMYFFSVGDYKVTLKLAEGKTMIWGCTCMHCSVFHGICPEVLCSYKLAVLKALPLKNGDLFK